MHSDVVVVVGCCWCYCFLCYIELDTEVYKLIKVHNTYWAEINGWMNGWMGWMVGWMHFICTYICTYSYELVETACLCHQVWRNKFIIIKWKFFRIVALFYLSSIRLMERSRWSDSTIFFWHMIFGCTSLNALTKVKSCDIWRREADIYINIWIIIIF